VVVHPKKQAIAVSGVCCALNVFRNGRLPRGKGAAMRLRRTFRPVVKEDPTEAPIVSHRLILLMTLRGNR